MAKYEIGPLTIVDDDRDSKWVNLIYTFTFCGVPNRQKKVINQQELDIAEASYAVIYPNGELDVIVYDADKPFVMREIAKFMSVETLFAFHYDNPGVFKGPFVFSDDIQRVVTPVISNGELQDRIIRRLKLPA